MDNIKIAQALNTNLSIIIDNHPKKDSALVFEPDFKSISLSDEVDPLNPGETQENPFTNRPTSDKFEYKPSVVRNVLILPLAGSHQLGIEDMTGIAPADEEGDEARIILIKEATSLNSVIERTVAVKNHDGSFGTTQEQFLIVDSIEIGQAPSIQTVYFGIPFKEDMEMV